jgi:hypothetical protein
VGALGMGACAGMQPETASAVKRQTMSALLRRMKESGLKLRIRLRAVMVNKE